MRLHHADSRRLGEAEHSGDAPFHGAYAGWRADIARPTLVAFGPWNEGNPPKPNAQLKGVVLLKYSDITAEQQHKMKDYQHSDDWSGAAWLKSGNRSAVVFVGTKGQGKCWYGFANGVVWPEGGPYPPVPPYPNDQRGWWVNKLRRSDTVL